MLGRRDKSRTDVVSVDQLKPVFSDEPVSVALPPANGRPVLRAPDPVLRPLEMLVPPSPAPPVCPAKRVCFQLLPSVPAWRNLQLAVRNRRICSAVYPQFLQGGILCRIDVRQSVPTADPALSTNS